MINKLNQLWIKLERQELKALKAFLAELSSQAMEEGQARSMVLMDDELLEERLLELKVSMDEYSEAYDELLNLTDSFNEYDLQLHDIDELLSDSIEKLFEDNTDFAANGVKASKEEQKKYLLEADKYMTETAEIFAFKNKDASEIEMSMEDMLKGLETTLNGLKTLTQLTGSTIKQSQITHKMIGKQGDAHHEHYKNKFKAACNKAICLNRIQSCKGKLDSVSSHCNDVIHQKTTNLPTPFSTALKK